MNRVRYSIGVLEQSSQLCCLLAWLLACFIFPFCCFCFDYSLCAQRNDEFVWSGVRDACTCYIILFFVSFFVSTTHANSLFMSYIL